MRNLSFFYILKNHWLKLLVVALMVFAVFSPALRGGLDNWDDATHVTKNWTIQSLDAAHLKAMFGQKVNKLYIPLTTLSFALEYHWAGLTPWVYHLNNILLHILNVGFVYILALRLRMGTVGALVASVLFGLHPAHVESVAWVTERKDVLYAFFYLLAMHAYLTYIRRDEKSFSMQFLLATFVCGILSMLAKPMALSLPLILFLLDWFEGRSMRRNVWLEKIPFILMVAGIAWISYMEHARVPLTNGLWNGILIWCWTLVFYIKQMLLPLTSQPIWHLPYPVGAQNPVYWVAVMCVLMLAVAMVLLRKHKWFILAAGFFLCSIFFLLRFDQGADVHAVAERFLYLPMLGMCLFAGQYVDKVFSESSFRRGRVFRIAVFLMCGLFVFFGVRTFRYTQAWTSPEALWRYQLSRQPDDAIALNNLATALRAQPEYADAEKVYAQYLGLLRDGMDQKEIVVDEGALNKAREVESLLKQAAAQSDRYSDPKYNLGKWYLDLGQEQLAETTLRELAEEGVRHADVYFNLAQLYTRQQRFKEALRMYDTLKAVKGLSFEYYAQIVESLDRASKQYADQKGFDERKKAFLALYRRDLEKYGTLARSYFQYGSLLSRLGMYESSIEYYTKALQMNPNYKEARSNLANSYVQVGQGHLAVSLLTKLIEDYPNFGEAYLNLGVIYNQAGQRQEAQDLYVEALQFPSVKADAHFYLGYLDEAVGRYRQAAEHYDAYVRMVPNNAEAYYNRGNVYVILGQLDTALESYKQSVRVNPDYMDAWINASIVADKLGLYKEAWDYLEQARILGYQAPEAYVRALKLRLSVPTP